VPFRHLYASFAHNPYYIAGLVTKPRRATVTFQQNAIIFPIMAVFKDKKVLVTGAGSGIGFGLCRKFAEAGALVALNDVNPGLAAEAALAINREIGTVRVHPCPFDVADVPGLREAVKTFTGRFGGLDVAVANAGITNYGDFLTYTPEDFDRLTAVNLKGTYFTAQAAALAMISENQPGRIIFLSSVTGVQAHRNLSAYGVTKAGIRMMAKALALELGPKAITVNAVAAGATITERTLQDDPDYERNWNGVAPNRRTATVDDIAAAVLFLASPEARHITGETLIVDGGWTIYSPLPANHPQVPA
jgi:3-oxoacyl-[acyl-carrier protein] reductase